MESLFKSRGVGVGLRPAHHSVFLNQPPASIKWIEVVSENYMPWPKLGFGRSFQMLQKLRENFPVALHGVSLNLGSVDDLDFDYLKRLKTLVDAINPEVVSDHLAWTGVDGKNLHDLLPVPYTNESLQMIADNIDRVQNFLGRRILIENPSSYLEFNISEMSEAEYISNLLTKADCGLLLDINNVYVSSVNHHFDPEKYLEIIPAERVGQIHLAGHSMMDGYLIDTHDQPVCEAVWSLYKKYTKKNGIKSSMIERDGNIPDWAELESELKNIERICHEVTNEARNEIT